MYLRTPKRYQPGKQRRHVLSLRWLWLWILTPIVVFFGYQIYERREEFAPVVQNAMDSVLEGARSGISTVTAPTPLPTVDPSQRLSVAAAAWSRGAIEQAIEEYQAVLPSAPNDLVAHYRTAFGLIMEGRSQDALEAAERTVTANPFASDAWAIRSLALTRNDRGPEAIASALQALSLNPNNARALAFMAEAYLNTNQPALAAQTVERALNTDPESFEAYYVRGLINWLSNFDYQSARTDFMDAYDRAPNLPYIAVDMAWIEWSLQNYDDGLLLLEEVIELNPNNLDALYTLGFYEYQVYGSPDKALDYLTRCVTISPQNRSCLSYLGTVQTGTGNNQAAAQTYQQLIETGTEDPRHFLAAGRAYINVGDCQSAIPLLQTGYDLERELEEPNIERLIVLEEFLIDCGAQFRPVYSVPEEPTSEEGAATEGETGTDGG